MKPKKQKEDDGLKKAINTPTPIEQATLQKAKKQAKTTFDDALPTLRRAQMWAQVENNEKGGVGARSLAHNPLRGRGAGWSSGMGLGRVDKL